MERARAHTLIPPIKTRNEGNKKYCISYDFAKILRLTILGINNIKLIIIIFNEKFNVAKNECHQFNGAQRVSRTMVYRHNTNTLI